MAYRMERGAYALTYGPTAGDRMPPGRHQPRHRGREGLRDPRRRGEVRRRQDHPRRAWASRNGAAPRAPVDTVITNVVILDYWGIVKAMSA
jgi:urease subunit alpha